MIDWRRPSASLTGMATKPTIDPADEGPAPLGGTRAEALQRLQVGLSLLGGVILLVALAGVIQNRAEESEAASVPQAASTVAATPAPQSQSDPLADAGVVPDLPAQPSPTPTSDEPILPEQGDAAPRR